MATSTPPSPPGCPPPTANTLKNSKTRSKCSGTNYAGAKIGLIVPDYVQAKTIADLQTYAKDFDGKITGITPAPA